MSEAIPEFTDLSEVYGQEGEASSNLQQAIYSFIYSCFIHEKGLAGAREAQERYATLARGFQERYGAAPELFARSPGNPPVIVTTSGVSDAFKFPRLFEIALLIVYMPYSVDLDHSPSIPA